MSSTITPDLVFSPKGTAGADTIGLAYFNGAATITGLADGTEVVSALAGDQLTVSALGGDDVITAQNGFPAGLALTLDGGSGNDTITGSDQGDILIGGTGNDVITGGRGNDLALLGTGNDKFIWNPGDGSDTVEGDSGTDTLQFNGSNAGENINITANGGRVLLTRDVAAITMDLNGVEILNVATLGSADHVTVGDLTGTGVKQVNVNLAASDGSPDTAADIVSVLGTDKNETVTFTSNGTETLVKGLAVQTDITNADNIDTVNVQAGGGNDTFDLSNLTGVVPILALDGGEGVDTVSIKGSNAGEQINLVNNGLQALAIVRDGVLEGTFSVTNVESILLQGQGGDDTLTAGNGFPTGTTLTIDGGAGNDHITGGDQADILIGGAGNDVVAGGRGNDSASLGSGNDTFVWNPGDGSDIVDGGSGTDTLQFNGSNAGENINIFANGDAARLTRDVANITMDMTGVEVINVATLGSADHVAIGDLTGTGVDRVNVDLGAFGGGGDGAVDTVSVVASGGNDLVKFSSNATETVVTGISADLHVTNAETTDIISVQAGLGNDTFDLSSLTGAAPVLALDGGEGVDTVSIKGSNAGEQINLVNNGLQALAIVRDGVLEGTFSVTNVESILLQGQGGDDTLTAGNGFPTGTTLTIDGGAGNDHITGGDQADILIGGAGNDVVAGGRGNDSASLGSGNDTFVWNPGDGSDIVDGGSGTDTLQFNGSNAGENINIFANGDAARLTRDVANITMDMTGVEVINVATLGSADHVAIGDLTGTGVDRVNVDLGAFGGGGDGAVDTVSVVASGGNDIVKFSSSATETVVTGISADLHVTNAETTDIISVQAGLGNDTFDLSNLVGPGLTFALDGGDGVDTALIKGSSAGDNLSLFAGGAGSVAFEHNGVFAGTVSLTNVENLLLQGQGGDDTLTVGNGFPAGVALTIDGGGGNDTLVGGDQGDTLLGGSGNDMVNGGRGNDVALLGSGDDTFVWNPGDGSDSVDGQGGSDTLQFNGSNAGENISISADAGHVDLFRNVANVSMDLNGIETVNVATLGSADNVTIGDLTGTDAKQVNIDLGSSLGSGDGAADTVSAEGTAHNDNIKLSTSGTGVSVTGLRAQVFVDHGETIDTLAIHGGLGNDHIDASGVAAGGMTLVLDGGAGNDALTGSAGHDVFINGETVLGFDASQDQLDLRGVASGQTSDWVLAQAHDDHGNVVFDFGASQMTLVGETVTQLHASDFILG